MSEAKPEPPAPSTNEAWHTRAPVQSPMLLGATPDVTPQGLAAGSLPAPSPDLDPLEAALEEATQALRYAMGNRDPEIRALAALRIVAEGQSPAIRARAAKALRGEQ